LQDVRFLTSGFADEIAPDLATQLDRLDELGSTVSTSAASAGRTSWT
jgi:hypothetical protein